MASVNYIMRWKEPELEYQANLITKYRIMLKHINKKHMENLIMVELQKKFNKDQISGVVIQEDPGTYKKEEPRTKEGQGAHFKCKKITNLDISSFEKKSKKDSSDLITLENKKGDKQGLSCSFKGCDFITRS